MSLGRRRFLALALAGLVEPATLRRAPAATVHEHFEAEVGMLYGLFSFRLAGSIEEAVDRAAGRYTVRIRGQGTSMTTSVESTGLLRAGRWTPLRTSSLFLVRGRESRVETRFEDEPRRIEYHARSETFFLGRQRVVDDVLTPPEGTHVDDVVSAMLNYADGTWPREPDGTLVTHVVRRHRPEGEKPDDVERRYRAELVPLRLSVAAEPGSARTTALFDLTRFSSWAREDRPARIVFDAQRRPETISSSLILGTSFTVRIDGA